MSAYYLPKETANLLTENRLKQCKNLGLILDKYPPQEAILKDKSDAKSKWLRTFSSDHHIDTNFAEHVYKRWLNTTTAVQAQHFSAITDWRMVVGLGGETVLETDLTLHHLYGIPFIPGSALKGLTRAYVTGEIYKSEKIEDDNAIVQQIFGTQKDAGTVIFFDAMPVNGNVALVLDIMNCHYPAYYGEKKLPTNDQSPNPITFLTVTNTTFMFALAPRTPEDIQNVELAKQWLQTALQKYGIGGKTSAGYGYFRDVHDEQERNSVAQPLPVQQAASISYVRPNIPKFVADQGISGVVVPSTDELRRKAPDGAKAFLRFREFPTKDVLIVVSADEAASWTSGQTKNCLFVSEEERNGCTVLICQPGARKKKKKG